MIRPPWLTTEPYVVIDLGTLGRKHGDGNQCGRNCHWRRFIFLLQIRTVVAAVLSGTVMAWA